MIQSYSRVLKVAVALGLFLPVVVAVCTGLLAGTSAAHVSGGYWLSVLAGGALALAGSLLNAHLLRRLEGPIEAAAQRQVEFLEGVSAARAGVAIAASAALSLFLELATIRWQGCVWEFFAFYKNLGLLSCFAGLGLGYALAGRDRIPLVLSAPLLAFQILLLEALRHLGGETVNRSLGLRSS